MDQSGHRPSAQVLLPTLPQQITRDPMCNLSDILQSNTHTSSSAPSRDERERSNLLDSPHRAESLSTSIASGLARQSVVDFGNSSQVAGDKALDATALGKSKSESMAARLRQNEEARTNSLTAIFYGMLSKANAEGHQMSRSVTKKLVSASQQQRAETFSNSGSLTYSSHALNQDFEASASSTYNSQFHPDRLSQHDKDRTSQGSISGKQIDATVHVKPATVFDTTHAHSSHPHSHLHLHSPGRVLDQVTPIDSDSPRFGSGSGIELYENPPIATVHRSTPSFPFPPTPLSQTSAISVNSTAASQSSPAPTFDPIAEMMLRSAVEGEIRIMAATKERNNSTETDEI